MQRSYVMNTLIWGMFMLQNCICTQTIKQLLTGYLVIAYFLTPRVEERKQLKAKLFLPAKLNF